MDIFNTYTDSMHTLKSILTFKQGA
jgi:hypothetical protein